MTEKVVVNHMTSHRARLTIPSRRKDREFISAVSNHFEQCPGVEKVRCNPLTACVVVEHKKSFKEILQKFLNDFTYPLDVSFSQSCQSQPLMKDLQANFYQTFKMADKKIAKWSSGSLDFFSVAGISLFGLSLFQMRRGMFLPAGLTLLILAYRISAARKDENGSL